jgi:hypothetical protein
MTICFDRARQSSSAIGTASASERVAEVAAPTEKTTL